MAASYFLRHPNEAASALAHLFLCLFADRGPLLEGLYSGLEEIGLGAAIIAAPKKHRKSVGRVAASFFTAVFPGDIAQYTEKRNAFGLDTDSKRFTRLFFQPILVWWALTSTK